MPSHHRQKTIKILVMAVSFLTAVFIYILPVFSEISITPIIPTNYLYNSQFISQSVPITLEPAKKYQVSLIFKNTGRLPWLPGKCFLISRSNIWGINKIGLLPSEYIKPGQTKTFTFEITAPSKGGIYTFQWQMLGLLPNRKYTLFGQISPRLSIKVNSPPTISPLDNQSTYEHKALGFDILGQDPDQDSLTYSASNLPQGATFDTLTHSFSWKPEHGQAGTYSNIQFTVSDGIASAYRSITITTLKTIIFGTIYTTDAYGQKVGLEGVNIDILNLTRTTVIASGITDSAGHFDVFYETWQDGTYFIRASKTGYNTYYGMATLRGNSMMPFSVTLLENVPPTGTVNINDGNPYTNSLSVNLSLSANDSGSGMSQGAQMQFSNDNITWSASEAYSVNKNWTLDSGDGIKTVYAKFKDVAGNWSEVYSDIITLDTVPPQITVISPLDNEVIQAR